MAPASLLPPVPLQAQNNEGKGVQDGLALCLASIKKTSNKQTYFQTHREKQMAVPTRMHSKRPAGDGA